MICKILHCRNSVERYELCKRHWKKSVRDMEKLIDEFRIKGTPYRATPDTCIEGFDSYYKSKRRNEKENKKEIPKRTTIIHDIIDKYPDGIYIKSYSLKDVCDKIKKRKNEIS